MSLFNALLHGLKQKIDAQTAYKNVVMNCIQETINITIDPESIISLKDSVLTLQVSPTIKTALLLKKDSFLQAMQQKGLKVLSMK